MKRFAALAFLIATATAAMGQAVRADISLQTYGPNVPTQGGPLPQALWIANATVQICAHPATTNSCTPITTYNDSAKDITCPADAQLVQLPGVACTNAAGTAGNVGFWYDGGLVDYIFTSSYGTFGPYSYSNGGGGGGSGCTTSGPPGTFQVANGTGGCAPGTVSVNGVPLTTPNPVNHVDSATVQFLNPSAGNITANVIPGSALTIQVEDSAAGVNQATLDFNSTLPAAPAGSQNCTWQNDSATGRISCHVPSTGDTLKPLITPPIAGQYVVLYPHVFTPGPSSGGATITGDTTGAVLFAPTQCSLTEGTSGTWSGYTLADYGISAGSVTAVYAAAVNSLSGVSTGRLCFGSPAPFGYAPGGVTGPSATNLSPSVGLSPWLLQQTTAVTGVVGSGIATATTSASLGTSSQTQIQTTMETAAPVLIVYYTGTPVTSTDYLNIQPPLQYNGTTNTLGLDPTFPRVLNAYSVASAPVAAYSYPGVIAMVSSTDCVTDDSTPLDTVLCKRVASGTSYVWAPMTSGGSGITALTGDVTAAGSGSVPTTLATVNSNVGTCGDATHVGQVTLNAKGLTTACTAVAISGGGGTPGGSTTQIQYNNAGAFGGDSGSTTDGAGNVTTKTLSTTGVAGQGGTWDATEGTAPSAASGHDVLYADSTAHCFKYSANNGAFACIPTSTGTTVSVNGSSVSTPNFNGSTPAAGSNGKNVTWQVSSSSVSAEIVGDGTATHYLDGTGAYSTPAGAATPSGTNGVIQIANTGGTALDSDSTISIDKTAHTVNVGTLPANFVSIGALSTPTTWTFDTTSPTTAALSLGGGTAASGKYIDGGTGSWTTLPTLPAQAADTVVQNATGSSAVPTAVAMPTCTSGADLYNTSTHSWSCVSTAGSGAMTNITGSVTVSGCVVSSGQCVVGTPGATMTFSSIPGSYRTLRIVFTGAQSGVSSGNAYMQFNSDTGANYTRQYLFANGASPSSGQDISSTQAPIMFVASSTVFTSTATMSTIDIDLYAGTTFKKFATATQGTVSQASLASAIGVQTESYFWNSTAAITAVTLGMVSNNFVAGTSVSIYGIN